MQAIPISPSRVRQISAARVPLLARPAVPTRLNRVLQVAAAMFAFIAFASAARADIFQWEYINPADPGQGKQQSTALAPGGAGVDAVPGVYLANRNLTMAYLIGADLANADAVLTNLTSADLSQANLTNASLGGANLTGANFRQANLANAEFITYSCGTDFCWEIYATLTDADFTDAAVRGTTFGGMTLAQLYSTASYKFHDLTGIGLRRSNAFGGNFAGQNLTNASFYGAQLTDAVFTGAEVRGASFERAYDRSVWGSRPYVLTGTGITPTQLYSTANYRAHDLSEIDLAYNNLAGANFTGQNLTNASFHGAWLTDADFTGAEVRGATFVAFFNGFDAFGTGITMAQLYSTASYKAHDLSGINFGQINLAGGSFVGQNLTNAYFNDKTVLAGADFTAADARGAFIYCLSQQITTNLIWPDGHIDGLDLDAGGLLVVRDYDGGSPWLLPGQLIPITVHQHMAMATGGALRMRFEADAWDSTISFAPGIPVTLGGTLELTFAADVTLASQVGRTFDLFDWTGVNPSGAFQVQVPRDTLWDTRRLYTAGEVTVLPISSDVTVHLAPRMWLAACAPVRCSLARIVA